VAAAAGRETDSNVILKGFDPARSCNVIKIVREINRHDLMERLRRRRGRSDEDEEGSQQGEAEALKKKIEEPAAMC